MDTIHLSIHYVYYFYYMLLALLHFMLHDYHKPDQSSTLTFLPICSEFF